jgi:hypothetical protein
VVVVVDDDDDNCDNEGELKLIHKTVTKPT